MIYEFLGNKKLFGIYRSSTVNSEYIIMFGQTNEIFCLTTICRIQKRQIVCDIFY